MTHIRLHCSGRRCCGGARLSLSFCLRLLLCLRTLDHLEQHGVVVLPSGRDLALSTDLVVEMHTQRLAELVNTLALESCKLGLD